MSELGFGLIGAGMIADFHVRAIIAARGAHVVCVASRTLEGASTFARQHDIPFATASIEDLVAHPGVDAVCITTPSGLHRAPALAAIRAGKHVMIEKPIDTTVEGTD
jgi:UDP-N-acetyl-2-amino-2-deoxyglucuronate dehydrogenase